jgi:hypothetical protein
MRNPLRRCVHVVALAVALCVLAQTSVSYAHNFRLIDPRASSPAQLGYRYTGLVESGLAVKEAVDYGFKAGEFIIQPRFFVETAYTTNFFHADTRDAEEQGLFTLSLRPGLAVFNPNYDLVSITTKVDAEVRIPLTEDEAAFSQLDVGVNASASALFFPKGVVSFELKEFFERTLWVTPPAGIRKSNRNRNELGGKVSFHPGGRALELSLGYTWRWQRYDDVDVYDRDEHHVNLLASWRFYPLTYAFIEGTFDAVNYVTARNEEEVGNHVSAMPVRVYAGVSGFITERFALMVRLGYGNSLLDNGDPADALVASEDYNHMIGQVQGTYRFTPKTVLHVGAARNFRPVALGALMSFWRAYMAFEQGIADIVLIHADFQYDRRDFGAWDPADTDANVLSSSTPERQEDVLRARLLVDIDISRIFGLTVGYQFQGILSDYLTCQGAQPCTEQSSQSKQHYGYLDHRVFLSANIRY